MEKTFSLSDYLNTGIRNTLKYALKASLYSPRQAAWMLGFCFKAAKALKKRKTLFASGEEMPAFLISSITGNCNLFCSGCYARENKSCGENLGKKELDAERWEDIFREAESLGISFVLLAGGEPLLRMDVLRKAALVKSILFPVFTNGTVINSEQINLFKQNRNLIPVLSIEGSRENTDKRRGKGTYDLLINAMNSFKKEKILYGVSVTLTALNIPEVTRNDFIGMLFSKGCRVFFFVEYVPVTHDTSHLAPSDPEREVLDQKLKTLRKAYGSAVFLSFPGDEKYSGGCLAAGRGFFHISPDGSAEPCPFSPFSEINLVNSSLREAAGSRFFRQLRDTGLLTEEHDGGCVLFSKEKEVKKLLDK